MASPKSRSPSRLRPMPSTAGRTLEMLDTAVPQRLATPGTIARSNWKKAIAKVAPPRSLVVSHELALLESADHTEKRALKLLRDELHDAVYSDEYSTSERGEVLRIPYFELTERLQKSRNKAADSARRDAESTTVELKTAKTETGHVRREVGALKKNTAKLRGEIDDLKNTILEMQKHVDTADARLAAREATLRSEIAEANRQVSLLGVELAKTKDDLVKATKCSDAFAKMEKLFEQPFRDKKQMDRNENAKRREPGTRAVAKQQLEAARAHEIQLLEARNHVIAQLDDTLLSSHVGGATEEAKLRKIAEDRYMECIDEISNSLGLCREIISEQETAIAHLAARTPEDFETKDKFYPPEALLGRYSVRLLGSANGGSTFSELQSFGEMCACCGSRAAECPQIFNGGSYTVVIPPRTTHLKVERVAPPLMSPTKTKHATGDKTIPNVYKGPLWAEFRRRTPVARKAIAVDGTLSNQLINTLLTRLMTSDRLWSEGRVGSSGKLPPLHSVQQSLFVILEARYHFSDVATVIGEGVLSLVENADSDEALLRLLNVILCGDRDAACARYFIAVRTVLRKVSNFKNTAENALDVLKALYSTLSTDKLDELLSELGSFSGNSYSLVGIESFVLELILRGKEPNLMVTVAALERYVFSLPDVMNLEEFRSFSRVLGPELDFALLDKLFVETLCLTRVLHDDSRCQTIKAVRGAEIVSYALFSLNTDNVVATINERLLGLPEWKIKRQAKERIQAYLGEVRQAREDAAKSGAGASANMARAEAIGLVMNAS